MSGSNKDHHWCDDHQAWTVHLPEDCELRQSHQQDDGGSTAMLSVLGYDSEEECELCSLTIMMCIIVSTRGESETATEHCRKIIPTVRKIYPTFDKIKTTFGNGPNTANAKSTSWRTVQRVVVKESEL
jgi:hypothetical protein